MPEKYLSETQGKPSIKLYCFTLDTPPGVACLARLRGRGGSAPGRNPFGTEEKAARLRGENCSIYILIVSILQVLFLALRIVRRK